MASALGGGVAPERPALGWSDLAGLRVGVFGLRMEGAASLRRLRRLGVVPLLVDDRPPAPSVGGLRAIATHEGGLEALDTCDVVVKSPGISRHGPAVAELVQRGVAVAGGLGLWLHDATRERVLCVTGTKGKSTTVALAGHLLQGLGHRCLVAGNIGLPPWDPDAGEAWDYWVLEVSSYQATDVADSPPVVGVTSLAPDHLDWHGSVEAYYRDKLSLCSQPGARRTVADAASAELRAHAGLLGPSVRWVGAGDPGLDGAWVEELGLAGAHYRRDALVARACLLELGVPHASDDARVAEAARGFQPLPHRFSTVGSVTGVDFVDDSLSTNVLPTLAALEALGGRAVALLVGGQDRGIDYGELGRVLARREAPVWVGTLPEAGARVHEAIEAARRADGSPGIPVEDFGDLGAATRAAFAWAQPLEGVVLLSPAAPSFGQFRDYAERASAFLAAMASCGGQRATPPGERSA